MVARHAALSARPNNKTREQHAGLGVSPCPTVHSVCTRCNVRGRPPRGAQSWYVYGGYGNLLPADLLERALRIADGRLCLEAGATSPASPVVIDPIITFLGYLGGGSDDGALDLDRLGRFNLLLRFGCHVAVVPARVHRVFLDGRRLRRRTPWRHLRRRRSVAFGGEHRGVLVLRRLRRQLLLLLLLLLYAVLQHFRNGPSAFQ